MRKTFLCYYPALFLSLFYLILLISWSIFSFTEYAAELIYWLFFSISLLSLCFFCLYQLSCIKISNQFVHIYSFAGLRHKSYSLKEYTLSFGQSIPIRRLPNMYPIYLYHENNKPIRILCGKKRMSVFRRRYVQQSID
ncbi:hypothetical protein UC3_02227 [Enterococcus phoeniculicola ATCC BAA-412]|uniref:Uncharacterized protein n=1 Tax=Enterococcus phoeniculicola ATCC BAA-412 TaxID=1158610 RepID=R3TKC3_9ENTE|nr:hypothetical protein UC3_02227 [Enterococcus phoeniculicola ATCC BAA-412]EOT79842.1 hypothetical protein I589_01354 [Enterococcus phoeniculicola ATCC BAA-412]